MPSLYLASKSPRRRELLTTIGVTDFEVMPVGMADVLTFVEGDEEQLPGESAENYVIRTAREKALAAIAKIRAEGREAAPVLAADTVVISDGIVLGKPADREEARRFMQHLSGRTHEVRTAVWVGTDAENLASAVSVSRVTFTSLSEEQIERYIATDEPYDKAGGYGIQGLAGLFIACIEGSYTGIMGLPDFETGNLLRPLGLTAV